MSTLVTTRMPDGSFHRMVVRREPGKKMAALSPLLYRGGGMGALGMSTDLSAFTKGAAAGAKLGPIGAAAGGVISEALNLFKGSARGDQVTAQAKGQTNQASNAYANWRQIAGKVPGRQLGLANMQLVWQGSVQAGNWPGAQGHPEYTIDAMNGCPACGGNTIADQVPIAVKAGVTDPRTIMNSYFIPAVRRTAKNPWAIPTSAENQQLVMDVIDAKVAQLNPNAPIPSIYPQAAPAALPAPAAAAPLPMATVTASAPVPSPMTALVPVSTPALATAPASIAPAAQVLSTALPPAQADQTAALIQQMMAQGANQQAAFTAAIQSLQASGTPITPQVQQAVAATTGAVQTAGGGLPSWLSVAGIGIGVVMLGFMLAKPKGAASK